jgi:hypothetical protein
MERLPRASPFTQADIEARSQLIALRQNGEPTTSKPVRPTGVPADTGVRVTTEWDFMGAVRHFALNCNFNTTTDTLNVRHIEECARCEDELRLIYHFHELNRVTETQETPGRKARAFQLAWRWHKARIREQNLLLRHVQNGERQFAEQALRRWQNPRLSLPQSVEQEAVRELGYIPNSRSDYALLRERTMHSEPRGRHKSWALHRTIHALQACAATWDKKLIWSDGRAPPKRLIQFLVEALRAARIKHPNPETNRSKFIALMLRPKKQSSAGLSGTPPEPSELERRLAKVFL